MRSDERFEVDVDHLLLVWDKKLNKRLEIEDIVNLLNEADNRIESLKKRSRQLFIMEKVIDRMLSKEEQMEFYNMVELEMIKDE